MEAFADVVRAGKALYVGVSEWTPKQLRAGHVLARELKISAADGGARSDRVRGVETW